MTEVVYVESPAEFDALLADQGTLMVNFTASWCGPCKKFAPVLEEIASENAESLRIVKVDIDAVEALKDRFHVMGVPTTMVFSEGEMMTSFVGGKSKLEVMELIEPLLEV